MKTSVDNFDFYLPEHLIAQFPAEERGKSRLLVLDSNTGEIQSDTFSNIDNYLNENDVLVINNTKVLNARLLGNKITGGKVEIFLLEEIETNVFSALTKGKLKKGNKILIANNEIEITDEPDEEGIRTVKFLNSNPYDVMDKFGHTPLPPYIKREDNENDKKRYQTVYSKIPGSVAAPTAGLHFTKKILEKLKNKGIEILEITLNVGIGTFRPVKTDFVEEHIMHREYYFIDKEVADKINYLKFKRNKNIVAVGTTTVRALESASDKNGKIVKFGNESTDIFITPGYNFKIINKMVTNFHLPKSTLFMMICAFAGQENAKKAYEFAIKNNFKFFSYGDAMFIK
jgi:S-adenosylmethionine:tRNA ribosyltransferase-isomerase